MPLQLWYPGRPWDPNEVWGGISTTPGPTPGISLAVDVQTVHATTTTAPPIPNNAAGPELDTPLLVDPLKIQAYRENIASQMNAQSNGPRFADLSQRIGGISIETSVQGASVLKVTLIDPMWMLPMSGFIQVDETGYLWPPIDVNFPASTDCVWRLCALEMTWDVESDGGEGNILLTFEDRSASLLREMSPSVPGGIYQGDPNQTLAGFLKKLVDNTNHVLKLRGSERIRLVELVSPDDPNYQPPVTDLPASAQSPLRSNPNKDKQGLDSAQQAVVSGVQGVLKGVFDGVTSISGAEQAWPSTWADEHAQQREHQITHAPPHGGTF